MKDLTIVILNFNSGEYLFRCLESIKTVKDEAAISIVVIDNNSFDDSLDLAKSHFKNAEYIENSENFGFSKGYNATLKNVKSEFVLLLNPDCLLEKGVIKELLADFEEYPKVGAATGKIILSNGKTDLTAHRGFPTPWASLLYALGDDSLYHLTGRLSKETHEVDAISGAFFLTKKSILEKVGFLDESFFLYGEDIDLSLRIKKGGYKIIYDPSVKITHYKGISSGLKKHSQEFSAANATIRKRAMNAFYGAMIIFYNKHYKNKYPFYINWLVYFGIYLRWGMALLKKTV